MQKLLKNYKLRFESGNYFDDGKMAVAGGKMGVAKRRAGEKNGVAKRGSAKIAVADFKKNFERGIEILAKQKHLTPLMAGGELDLTLVDDPTIQMINRDYRGIDKPTDVVSLSYFEAEILRNKKIMHTHKLIGEIFISVDTAIRQAEEHNVTLKHELQFLFVHGLLHVFGYDHEKKADRELMFDLQDEILGTKKWRSVIE